MEINHEVLQWKCLVPICRKLIKKIHNFQFILLTFLSWAPGLYRKFQIQNLLSYALVW